MSIGSIDETEPPEPPVYDQVVRELDSGYKSEHTAAMKEITGVIMTGAASSPALDDIVATLAVCSDSQSPGYESYSNQRPFRVGLADVWRLAETAPGYRWRFNQFAADMVAQLEKDIAASKRGVADWCDQGLPTQAPTAVGPPLRLRRKNGFQVTHGA